MVLGRWQPFEWIVASRFLREGRMQSLFIIGGVAIGVAVIVFMSALLQGLQANLVKRVLTAQPHIQVLPPKERVRVQHGEDDADVGRRVDREQQEDADQADVPERRVEAQ